MLQQKWKNIFYCTIPEDKSFEDRSHMQLPTVLQLKNSTRIFFASRDKNQCSSVCYVDLRIDGDKVYIDKFSNEAVLTPGKIGTFDQHGVFPSCVVENNNKYYMYYIGWEKGFENPLFTASIGLAVSTDGENFEKLGRAPIMARSDYDPCLVTSPHVFFDNGVWNMNYVSGFKWERDDNTNQLQSYYHIKSAVSDDLINWDKKRNVAIDLVGEERNIARPSVYREDYDSYHMWYSYVDPKIGKYRMGYADSNNGKNWIRKDQNAGIGLDENLCKDMICYPQVFKMNNTLYMLYNGDKFGMHGFGIAVCKD